MSNDLTPSLVVARLWKTAEFAADTTPAGPHFTYEVVHLVTALTWVVRMKARGDQASPPHNLCVEGVLLDARALADSLRSTRTKPDDLFATEYLFDLGQAGDAVWPTP
jgi:hypothetical protein